MLGVAHCYHRRTPSSTDTPPGGPTESLQGCIPPGPGYLPIMRGNPRLLLGVGLLALLAVGCDRAESARPTSVAGTPREAASTTTTTTTTTALDRRFPPEAESLRQGDRVFGVFVAVERRQDAPEILRAKEELRRVGYS